MGAPTPETLLAAIASQAAAGTITADVPYDPTGTNAASILGGFPKITMQSILSGGEPPLGPDINAYLFLLSSHTLYVESGQLYLFNSDLATAIGGYAAGTVLGMADGSGMWLCIAGGNATNPDTGGAGWVPLTSYGYANVNGLTGGSTTLTAAQSKRGVLVLSGALVGNQTIVLPATVQQWLIINNTTGAFSTTVTAGGTGVVVPQGGFASPVPVYGVGDGNIYPQSAAAVLPNYSQSPIANTLAERTNAGYLLATYLNQNSSSSEDPPIGAVFVENTAADGFLRKAALSYFVTQIFSAGATLSYKTSGVNWEYTLSLATSAGVYQIKLGFFRTATTQGAGNKSIPFLTAFPNACPWAIGNTYNRNTLGSGVNFTQAPPTAAGFYNVLEQGSDGYCSCMYLAFGK